MEGYCMKCRKKQRIRNAVDVRMKNGRYSVRGECSDCGTRIVTIRKTGV